MLSFRVSLPVIGGHPYAAAFLPRRPDLPKSSITGRIRRSLLQKEAFDPLQAVRGYRKERWTLRRISRPCAHLDWDYPDENEETVAPIEFAQCWTRFEDEDTGSPTREEEFDDD